MTQYDGAQQTEQHAQQEFSKRRMGLKPHQIDRILGNGEVYRRWQRYTKKGRTTDEGPMSEAVALEEAIMDVFEGGGEHRQYRRYHWLATEANINRMKALRKGTDNAVNEWLGDEVAVRSHIRTLTDPTALTRLMLAEYQGRNDTGKSRDRIVSIIKSRLDSIEARKHAPEISAAEKDRLLAEDGDVPAAAPEPAIEEGE